MTKVAGYYIAQGKGHAEVEALLLGANQRNRPPLKEEQISKIVRSVWKTHSRNHPDHSNSIAYNESDVNKDGKGQTHAEILIDIGLGSNVELFHDQSGRPFAFVGESGFRSIWPVSSRNFQDWLAKRFFNATGKAPSKDSLRQSLQVLEGTARFTGEQIRLHNRVAWHEGAIYYDLADKKGRIIKVTPGHWEILGEGESEDLPILFRRYEHQQAQLTPDPRNSDSELLLRYLHLRGERNKILFLIYVISCFIPQIPHPILVLHGPQGAAKSTTARITRRLVDPSVNDVQTLTRKIDQTVQALAQNWFCAFDNISHIDGETSDALCRASTGGTLSKRQLYTDEDTITFELQNCVSLNGINVMVTRPDLMDRALLFEATRIPDEKRKETSEVLKEFDRDRPRILAGIFDTLSKAMEIKPWIKADRLPRMADFARWGMAINEAIGHGAGRFLELYSANISQQHEEILNANPVGTALMVFMNDKPEWSGLMSKLHKKLEEVCESLGIDRRSRFWPGAPHVLTRRLKELETTLAGVGITLHLGRSNKGSNVTLTKGDTLRRMVGTQVTIQDHYEDITSEASVATDITREDNRIRQSISSVGLQGEEEKIKQSAVLKPEKATQDTPAKLLTTLTLDSCSQCEYLYQDKLWVGCKKAGTILSMLKVCPLDDRSSCQDETGSG
jgi:hypothetical protein